MRNRFTAVFEAFITTWRPFY